MIPVHEFTEEEVLASICKASFFEFVKTFWHTIIAEEPVWNWHIEFLCNELQAAVEKVIAGQDKEEDIVINVPPGTTKSTIVSIMLDAWATAKMPSLRFLGASFAHNLAQDLSRKTRDVMKSDLYKKCFPEVVIREEQDSKSFFINTRGGVRYAIGSGGVVVGMHFHLLVVDDPIDPQSAVSEIEMKEVNRWIESTLSQRKVDKRTSLTILVMQRLAQGDPTDEFLKNNKCKHICLPAELSDDVRPKEVAKMYVDKLLDPIRLSRKELEKERKRGDYFFAAQYMQTPIPEGGGMFIVSLLTVMRLPAGIKWKKGKIWRYWDKAASKAKRAAYTVGVKMAEDTEGRIWVLDVKRGKWDSTTREVLIHETAKKDGKDTWVAIEQEPGSGGKDSALATVKRLKGFRIIVDKVTGDKEARADPFSDQVNGGNVYLVEAPWNKDYIEELRYFPYSKRKDQVDASGGCFTKLTGSRRRAGALQ